MSVMNQEEMYIDLRELFLYLKKRLWLIVIVTVASLLAGFFASKVIISPKYTASTRIFVLNRSNESAVVYSDIQISSQFIYDYKELITGRNVTSEVISRLRLNMSDEALKRKITVTAPANTRILQIDVEDTDPERAARIANTVWEVAAEQIEDIMDADAVRVVYSAEAPTEPSSPKIKKNALLCAFGGAVLVIGVLTVLFITDDTVRTEEDVERYLSLPLLGVVPVAKGIESGAEKGRGFHVSK